MTRANLIKTAADAITGQGSDPQHLATLAVDAILAELPKPNGFWKVTHNDDPPLPDDVEKYLRETMGAEEVWETKNGDGK